MLQCLSQGIPMFLKCRLCIAENIKFLHLHFKKDKNWCVYIVCYLHTGPPLWSSGQSFWLQIQRSRDRFPTLPDFLSGSGSGTGYTQPREPREVN